MIKVYTDSTSYIPKHLIEKYNINILPLSVSLAGESYVETEITNEFFYKKMRATDEFPKSSQPLTENMRERFEADVAQGHTVVGVFISSKMSGTYSGANLAKNDVLEKYPDGEIYLVDSEANCMQLGFAAIAGAKAAHDGEPVDSVITAIMNTILRSRFIFIPESLAYLEKGGRIGKASALLGNILHLIPVLTIRDGETTSMAKVRTHSKAVKRLVKILLNDKEALGLDKILVHHIDCKDIAIKLRDQLKEHVQGVIDITAIGPVVGTHVGPGSLGIVYVTKDVHPYNMGH